MSSPARFALIWFVILYTLNTFIGPMVGINNVAITPGYMAVNFLIWGGASVAVYFILKRKQKKSTGNEKMD